jgi:acyl-CoA reductase-like NAD-dependent aldehyde dehydrogenase
MVLKPSEIAPFDGIIWAEILHEAGVPKGVFNLINGIVMKLVKQFPVILEYMRLPSQVLPDLE